MKLFSGAKVFNCVKVGCLESTFGVYRIVCKCKLFLKPICFQYSVNYFVTSLRSVRYKSLFEKRCESSEIVQKLCSLHVICLFCSINRVLPFCDDFIVNMLISGRAYFKVRSVDYFRHFCLLSFRYQLLEQWDATNAYYFIR